jgi:hypothetical protein
MSIRSKTHCLKGSAGHVEPKIKEISNLLGILNLSLWQYSEAYIALTITVFSKE